MKWSTSSYCQLIWSQKTSKVKMRSTLKSTHLLPSWIWFASWIKINSTRSSQTSWELPSYSSTYQIFSMFKKLIQIFKFPQSWKLLALKLTDTWFNMVKAKMNSQPLISFVTLSWKTAWCSKFWKILTSTFKLGIHGRYLSSVVCSQLNQLFKVISRFFQKGSKYLCWSSWLSHALSMRNYMLVTRRR